MGKTRIVIGHYAKYFRPEFMAWLAENWHVYKAFEAAALHLIDAGREHFSARSVVHEIRHYSNIAEKNDLGLKINNNLSPDLARVFVILHPERAGFWEFRRADWREFLAAVGVMRA